MSMMMSAEFFGVSRSSLAGSRTGKLVIIPYFISCVDYFFCVHHKQTTSDLVAVPRWLKRFLDHLPGIELASGESDIRLLFEAAQQTRPRLIKKGDACQVNDHATP
jgi:hypothetical protein